MIFSTDKYLGKEYRQSTYNCWHFVREVWMELTGVDLKDQTPKNYCIEAYNKQATDFAATLTKVDKPQDPCLVLMQRQRIEPHIGVFYKGRLLHLNIHGAQYRPLDQITVPYPTVTYYVNRNSSP